MFSRAVEQSKIFLTYFLKLSHVKDFQFALAVELGNERTSSPSQNNTGLTTLPPVYKMRDDNLFMLNLKAIHTKAVKSDDAEVETAIWNGAAAGVLQGGYRAKSHATLLQHLRNIMVNRFKCNVERSFVWYMVEAYCPSRSV